jgi:aminomuconate-semialdehyde/2-hydroxymuconate-6-semialdehyde dehydrogenase
VNITERKPVGVVALVTPWNLPLYLLTWKGALMLCLCVVEFEMGVEIDAVMG